MAVLSIIEAKDREDVNTDIKYLAKLARMFKSQIEYIILNLFEEGYIEADNEEEEEGIKPENESYDNRSSEITVTATATRDLGIIEEPDALRTIQDL